MYIIELCFLLTAHKQVDPSSLPDGLFVLVALPLEVRSVSIQNVDIGRVNVNVLEEVCPHVGMVALRVVVRDA